MKTGRSKRVMSMLLSGEMTVTGLSKIANICKADNTEKVLDEASNRSCRELDRLRARYCPQEPEPEKVKPVFVKTALKVESGSTEGGKNLTANAEGNT
jgi:hypothetical protein